MEEQFKKKLSEVKIDWDKEQLWQELEPKLPTKKKRFGWLGLLLFLLLGLGSILWFYPFVADSADDSSLTKEQKAPVDASEDKVYSGQKAEAHIGAIDSHEVESSGGHQEPLKTREQTLAPLQKGKDEVPQNNSTKLITTLVLSQTETPIGKNNMLTPQLEQLPGIRDSINVAKPEFGSLQADKTREDALSSLNTSILSVLPFLDALPFRTLPTPENAPEWKGVPEAKRQLHPGLFLDLAAGIGHLSRNTITAPADSVLRANKKAEKTMLSVAGDLGVGYQFRSGIFFKSGLQYRRILEHLEWGHTEFRDSILPDYEKAYFELVAGGDTVYHAGPTEARVFETRRVFHKNSINIVNIPVEVGFEKQIQRVTLSAHAGLKIAVFAKFKGRVVDAENTLREDLPIDLDNRIGYYFGLGLGYQIKPKTSLFLRSNFEQSPSILMDRARQDYRSYHLFLGIKTYLSGE